jgi:hypothetical protein
MPVRRKMQAALDTRRGVTYNPRVMDSRNVILTAAPVALSSWLWNWWAVPTAQ